MRKLLADEACAAYIALITQREKFLMGGFPGNIVHQQIIDFCCILWLTSDATLGASADLETGPVPGSFARSAS